MVGRVDRFTIAKQDIVQAFSEGPKVLHERDVTALFDEKRAFWRLAKSMSTTAFLTTMRQRTQLKPIRFAFPQREVSGYTWGSVPLMETLLGLVAHSYYSHYTALRIHGLTEQVPKTLYLSHERRGTQTSKGAESAVHFDQSAIDSAFAREPRASKNELELPDEGVRVVLLQGAQQDELGVVNGEVNLGGDAPLKLRYTNLERTLIDSVVRPFYCGGVPEVAKAFQNARNTLSTNTMAAMLRKMAFGYPYHQAIGFYLERSGYKESAIKLFEKLPMERDFYLTHAMGSTSFNKRWRLYVPKGF